MSAPVTSTLHPAGNGARARAPAPRGFRTPVGLGVVVIATAVLFGAVVSRTAAEPSQGTVLILLALLMPFVVVVVGDPRRFLLVLIALDIPLQLDVNLGYREAATEIGALGGLSVSVTTIALAVLYGLWTLDLLLHPDDAPRPQLRVSAPLLVYVLLTAASILVAADPGLAGFEVALVVQSFLLYLYVASTISTREEVRSLVTMLLVGLLLEAAIMVVLARTGAEFTALGVAGRVDAAEGGARVGGTIGSPNTAASYFVALLPLALAALMTPARRVVKRLAAVGTVLGAVALIQTQSRGGWLGLSAALAVVGFVARRRGWLPGRVVMPFAIGALLVLIPFSGSITGRLFGDDQGTADSRRPLNNLTIELIEARPVLGSGANNIGQELRSRAGLEETGTWIYTVHNKYLLVAAEAGIAALVAWSWFLVATVRRGRAVWRSRDPSLALLALGLTAGFIGLMVHMLVEVFQSRPQIGVLLFVAGLLVAMQRVVAEAEEHQTPALRQQAAGDREPRPNQPAIRNQQPASAAPESAWRATGLLGEKRLRVVVLSYEFPEFCVALANGLTGHADVRAFLPKDTVAPFLGRLDPAVDLVTFRKPRLRQPYQQLRVARELLRKIDRFQPDVVHVQQGHMWFNFALSRLRRYALVLTIHDPIAHLGDAPSQKTPRAVWHYGFRQADHFIVHTEYVKRWVVRELGVRSTAVHTVPLAFETDPELPPSAVSHSPTVLFFGRIWPYKGLMYLVRAEPAISEAVPDVEIVIAGEGEDLAKYRSAMAHPDRFAVHDQYISPSELAELFGRADVIVLPYVDATQSGVVPLAYAYGKPVVATTVGGLPEMVEHGVTGLLVPPRDEAALAEAVIQLLRDAELRYRMGAAGRRLVRERWSPAAVAAATVAVYREAISEHAGARP